MHNLICKICEIPFQSTDARKLTCSKACAGASIGVGGSKHRGAKSGAFKHGATLDYKKTTEYRAWVAMRERCNNPNHVSYKYYGAIGIRVYAEWDKPDGFASFLAHIGPKPSPELTLDRIDGSRGYEPENVRWADRVTQNRNQRPRAAFTHCRRGHPRTPENRVANGTPTGACGPCRQLKKARGC